MGRGLRLVRWVGIAVVSLACGAATQDWPTRPPINVRHPGAFRTPPVMESSGATMSRRFPGRFWTINDSENPATLFLADTTGKVRGFARVPNAANTDWEALSSGPCADQWCLYIGDIGDNRSIRRSVTIYRVPEPTPSDLSVGSALVRDSLTIHYPDGPKDAESLVVTKSGDLAIIAKGRTGPALVYWIAAAEWPKGKVVARSIGVLPIPTSLLLTRLVTDAALSPDEQILAVRTYQDVYLFRRTARSTRLPDEPAVKCPIDGVDSQGEGLAWRDASTLLMTSEIARFRAGSITLLECPVR